MGTGVGSHLNRYLPIHAPNPFSTASYGEDQICANYLEAALQLNFTRGVFGPAGPLAPDPLRPPLGCAASCSRVCLGSAKAEAFPVTGIPVPGLPDNRDNWKSPQLETVTKKTAHTVVGVLLRGAVCT